MEKVKIFRNDLRIKTLLKSSDNLPFQSSQSEVDF